MTGMSVALLGAIFLLYAHRGSWPYVRWMAGSALVFGLLQMLYRAAELLGAVRAAAGEVGPFLVMPCLAALVVGLHTYLSPKARRQGLRFLLITAVGFVLSALVVIGFAGEPLRGPLATAVALIATSGWLVWRWWRRERWFGQLVLAASFLLHPALLWAAHRAGMDALAFRQITPMPIVVIYFLLMTLILQRDARQLAAELRERELAEGRLQQLAGQLDNQVRARTGQLEEINQGLRSFSGMVSHDLRGPLRNIHGLAEVACESIEEGQPALATPLVRKMGQEALRASRMVGDLLSLAQADQQPAQKSPVDFAELTQQCVARLAQEYPGADRLVRLGPLPVLPADRGLMEHVLINLIGNALKYGQAVRELQVTVQAESQGPVWRFSVADNGPGFDGDRAGELFRPFSRLAEHAVPGTGLGLTVVRRAVQQHGGEVGAAGEPGRGATFWWTLPAT
ncbi:HAMP domain-containing sensor histidine kinase [Hydrogenophaga sp.]|uniref:sensor histidine kinase n=1 Tax=Hydrogenophaga sp. TaxID=1904254 RepID=UPI0025BC5597|nr:HAMP domain-containing sensor histidine kinase [Hydrogenophaga sp.]